MSVWISAGLFQRSGPLVQREGGNGTGGGGQVERTFTCKQTNWTGASRRGRQIRIRAFGSLTKLHIVAKRTCCVCARILNTAIEV